MRSQNYYPANPKKGEAFTIFYGNVNNDGRSIKVENLSGEGTLELYKDGTLVRDVAGEAVHKGGGVYQIDLSASDMDANTVYLHFEANGDSPINGIEGTLFIVTTGGANAKSTLADIVTDVADVPSENPTLQEAISFLYQYFRKRRDRQHWSLLRHIIRG